MYSILSITFNHSAKHAAVKFISALGRSYTWTASWVSTHEVLRGHLVTQNSLISNCTLMVCIPAGDSICYHCSSVLMQWVGICCFSLVTLRDGVKIIRGVTNNSANTRSLKHPWFIKSVAEDSSLPFISYYVSTIVIYQRRLNSPLCCWIFF